MPDAGPPDRIPVTLLTGFLGAGKTTLLNRLLADPGFRDTAVVVNEFGAVGVDGDLVETAGDRAFAMTLGCLCCTDPGDIRLTLLRLAEDAATGAGPAFRRLVIETTGLADPGPPLRALMTSAPVLQRFALNGVVTVVDAAAGARTLDGFAEARRQAGVADLIALTKADLTPRPEAAALARRLAALNPNARVLDAAKVAPAEVFGLAAFDPELKPPEIADWLRFERPERPDHDHDRPAHPRHGDDVAAYCVVGTAPVNAWDVQDAIEALQAALGPDLLRLKAIVALDGDPDRPVVLHAVQHVLHPPGRLAAWPAGPRATRLVVIARGPDRARAPEVLARFLPGLQPPAPAPAPAARGALALAP